MSFFITLTSVAIMLCYAIPGFIFVKSKKVSPDAIPAFANVLMYLCSPCLTIYSFTKADFTYSLVKDIIILFVCSIIVQIAILAFFYILLRKKIENVKYRIYIIATTLGNCAFMGVPLLEAVMPDYSEAIIMSVVFYVGMNLIGWTLASAIITNDMKYVSVKKALFNPVILSLLIAIPLFVTHTKLPLQVNGIITLVGRMSTPMCMLIMGMRLATVELKSLFTDVFQYATVFIKQIIMPFIGLGLICLFPVSSDLKRTMFILCATPIASVVLNFAEMLGTGQKVAANLVLLGTLLSVITIPLMMLIY